MTDEHPSRAVARYDGPRTVQDLERYAQLLAVNTTPDGRAWRNEALPATFRGNPASVAFAVEYARALDVSPVTAIIGIHIVDGKPTASAGLISALIRRAGHKIRTWIEGSIDDGTAKAITTIIRADDPEFEYRSEWTLDRAVRAELMKRTPDGRVVAAKPRSAWATYPENMLKARSVTECARDAAEDAILGVHYTPEELGADVDETGDVVYTVTQVPTPPTPADAPAPAQTPAGGTPGGDPSPAPSNEEPDLAAAIRDQILAARSIADLVAVWNDPAGISSTKARAESLVTHDHEGTESTVLDLFTRAGNAIRDEGVTLTGETVEDTPDDGTPAAPDPTPDSDDDGDVVDGEVVEEGVTGGNDTPGQETGGPKGSRPRPTSAPAGEENRHDLGVVMARLREENGEAFADVVAYATREGLNPNTSEEAAAQILDAISDGSALRPVTIRETLLETPVELLTRLLGATVIHEERTTQEEAHARDLAARADEARREDHDDAVAARPAGGRPSRDAAAKAAREAIAKTRKS